MRGEFKASATRRTQPVNCNHDQPHAIKRAAETVSHSASNCRSPLPRTLSDGYRRPSASERSPTNGIPLFRPCELPVTNCQLPITNPAPLAAPFPCALVSFCPLSASKTGTNAYEQRTRLHTVAREKNNPPELHPQFHFTHHASRIHSRPTSTSKIQSSPKQAKAVAHAFFDFFPKSSQQKEWCKSCNYLKSSFCLA